MKRTYHGLSKSRLYAVYCTMKSRCYKKYDKNYKNYGARGIKICKEWLGENGFLNFYKWAMENGYDENAPRGKQTIDRIDVNGNYEPSNCRLTDMITQCRNKRDNVYYCIDGEKLTLAQISEKYKVSLAALTYRVYRGWELKRAIEEEVSYARYYGKRYEYNGKNLSLTEWASELGVPRTTLGYRLKSGRPYEIVFTKKKDIHVLKNKAVSA